MISILDADTLISQTAAAANYKLLTSDGSVN